MNNHFLQSKIFRNIIVGLVCVIAMLCIFRAGMIVGFRQAQFSSRWGHNYFQNFGGPSDFERGTPNHGLLEAHGSLGSVIKIDPNDIVIQGRDGAEKIILITERTMIRMNDQQVALPDIKLNDNVIVIGSPNESGQIEAQLIRVLDVSDMPQSMQISTTTSSTTAQ